jgi:predicted nuclease of predicted toxin-antitoxin system
MRLLLDEHLSSRIAEALRARGHDVVSVFEAGLAGVSDRAVWAYAIAEHRVCVTYNVDDFMDLYALFFQQGITHPGLVVIAERTIPQGDIGALVRALEQLLKTDPDLTDQVTFLPRAS